MENPPPAMSVEGPHCRSAGRFVNCRAISKDGDRAEQRDPAAIEREAGHFAEPIPA